MLSPETIATIKATIPVLQTGGEALTRHFYRRMFNANPEVRAFFNPAHQHAGTQQRALAAAICAYAQHIENPAALAGAVELIAQKHVSLDVKPEHYPIVGEHLLASIQEVLGEAATPAILDAWAQAYGVLADLLIRREAQIYAEHRERHGWSGFKPFVVKRKVRESSTITSFYLAPADGSTPRAFHAGQYVTVRVPGNPKWHATTMRNYSLSGKPGGPYYRISVKREPAPAGGSLLAPAGLVSNYLHDRVGEGATVDLAPPCGEFVLKPTTDEGRPLVFISGGVGVTPVLAMLHAALDRDESRDVWFIHGAIDGDTHAFRDEIRRLAGRHPRLQVHVRYSKPLDADCGEGRCHSTGVIDLSLVRSLIPGPDAEFYFCGPKAMMAGVHRALTSWGVKPEDLNYEFFGPAQELTGGPGAAAEPAHVSDAPRVALAG